MDNNYLIIGDTHLKNWIPGYLDAQIKCIQKIIKSEWFNTIIFLGDIFDDRNAKATELLAFDDLLTDSESYYILLRGNHDSETKADDGITVLNLFKSKKNVRIVEHIQTLGRFTFIPHYENENTIIKNMERVPADNVLFGHFGFRGCINSVGSYDFSIDPDLFPCDSYLGHVHRFNRPPRNKKGNRITVLGTPYTTSFSESEKESYYGVLRFRDGQFRFEWKLVDHGPTYIQCNFEDLEKYENKINDINRFILLRVYVDKFIVDGNAEIATAIQEKYPNIKYLEIRFKSTIDDKKTLSDFEGGILYSMNEGIIDAYLEENTSNIPIEELRKGLELLKNDRAY